MKISLRIILIGVCCSLLLTANHESLAALQPEEEALINVFEKVSPAVVFIKNAALQWDLFSTDLYEIPQGAGSGFIWDDQGHVITNFHVIYQADKIEVILNDQKSYEAKVIGISPDHDLAVLKINAPTQQLKSISIGSSKGLKVGQKALSIGNPFGLDHSLTTGVVSALGRSMNSIGGRKIHNVIQTDAAINPGNSGGPLLDSSGNLIGVSTSIYSPSGAYAGVGFAIPVDIVKRVVPQLIKYGRVKRAGVKKGAIILDIQRKSASDQAGLQATRRNMLGNIIYGDVIVVVDKQPIESNEDLVTYLETKNEGEKINLKFMRGTKEYGTTVILQEIRR